MEKRGYGQKILNTTIDNNSVSKSEGFKESRIRGVKWFSWYLFSKLRS